MPQPRMEKKSAEFAEKGAEVTRRREADPSEDCNL